METVPGQIVLVTDQHPLTGIGTYFSKLRRLINPIADRVDSFNLHYFRFDPTPESAQIPGQTFVKSRLLAPTARRANELLFESVAGKDRPLVHLCGASYHLAERLRPTVATAHDIRSRTLGSTLAIRPKLILLEAYAALEWISAPRQMAMSSGLVSVSRFTQRRLSQDFHLRSSYIPHWVESDAFRPRSMEESRESLGLPTTDTKLVLNVGAGTSNKNLPLLEWVASHLPDDYVFVKVGYPLREQPGRVLNLGLMSPARYALAFNSANVYVHTSFREGFGIPLIEALSAGLPVVAVANPPAPEVLGTAALLVPPDSPRGMIISAIRQAVENPGERERLLSSAARELVAYSASNVREMYREFYLRHVRN